MKIIKNKNRGKDFIYDEIKTRYLTKADTITVTTQPDGSLLLTTRIDDNLIKKTYYYYTRREAVKLFKNHIQTTI